ncbi:MULTISPECIES: hypothetical protein [Gordonia]|nr:MULTISPECIES: hypothetical protein [Gordonia]
MSVILNWGTRRIGAHARPDAALYGGTRIRQEARRRAPGLL